MQNSVLHKTGKIAFRQYAKFSSAFFLAIVVFGGFRWAGESAFFSFRPWRVQFSSELALGVALVTKFCRPLCFARLPYESGSGIVFWAMGSRFSASPREAVQNAPNDTPEACIFCYLWAVVASHSRIQEVFFLRVFFSRTRLFSISILFKADRDRPVIGGTTRLFYRPHFRIASPESNSMIFPESPVFYFDPI